MGASNVDAAKQMIKFRTSIESNNTVQSNKLQKN